MTIVIFGCLLVVLASRLLQDTQPPTITFTSDKIQLMCPTTALLMEGVKASDTKDGDLTTKVYIETLLPDLTNMDNLSTTVELKEYQLRYVVIDQANNITKKTRTLQLDIMGNPKLELLQPLTFVYDGLNPIKLNEYFILKDACGNQLKTNLELNSLLDYTLKQPQEIKIKYQYLNKLFTETFTLDIK